MSITYLCVPYTHEDETVRQLRFVLVNRVAGKLIQQGLHIYSPISHSHPIALVTDLPTDWDYWQHYCEEMLFACGSLMVLTIDGWRESIGVQAEIELALAMGKPIQYVSLSDGEIVITAKPQDGD